MSLHPLVLVAASLSILTIPKSLDLKSCIVLELIVASSLSILTILKSWDLKFCIVLELFSHCIPQYPHYIPKLRPPQGDNETVSLGMIIAEFSENP